MSDAIAQFHAASTLLAATRPTAVNLFWAIERMKRCAETVASLPYAERNVKLADEDREHTGAAHAGGQPPTVPFWRGEATGLASSRHMVYAALPRSGRDEPVTAVVLTP